jgi:hypothetical protein
LDEHTRLGMGYLAYVLSRNFAFVSLVIGAAVTALPQIYVMNDQFGLRAGDLGVGSTLLTVCWTPLALAVVALRRETHRAIAAESSRWIPLTLGQWGFELLAWGALLGVGWLGKRTGIGIGVDGLLVPLAVAAAGMFFLERVDRLEPPSPEDTARNIQW